MRLALFGALWARSKDGTVVASVDNPSATDDLDWLDIQPDEMADPLDPEHVAEVAAELVEEGRAYYCYCTQAEFREMPVNPAGFPEEIAYDERCRKLTPSDRAALEKMGRSPRVRLILPEDPPKVPGLDTEPPTTDFPIVEPDGSPTDLFGAVLSPLDDEATGLLVDGGRPEQLAHWMVIAKALGWDFPEFVVLSAWLSPDGTPIGDDSKDLSIASLRAAGFHPHAIMLASARAGWDPGEATDLEAMAEAFSVEDLSTEPPALDMEAFHQLNGDVLRALADDDLIAAVGEHLERRGFPFMEREEAWKARFVKAVAKEMTTLADAEEWAALLLTATADYDRDVAQVLRNPDTHELIDLFEVAMKGVEGDGTDARAWRSVLSELRTKSSKPGRALATLRMVLTGQRRGPGLPAILALLGVEGCQARIEKARRYTG